MSGYIDLHLHSSYSDGTLTPAQLVRTAAAKKLKAIALCDHDSVSGIDEARTEGDILGVEVIPAVELSVQYKEYSDVHLLGYYINHHDEMFLEKLQEFRERRAARGIALINRINDVLTAENRPLLSTEEITGSIKEVFGRPHIARALVATGAAIDVQDAFSRYLEPNNIPKLYFLMNEAISEIKRIGGLSILAHPTSITRDIPLLKRIVEELVGLGLDGMEVYNNMCCKNETQLLNDMAVRLNLLITGGSDFHGVEGDVDIGTIRGGRMISGRYIKSMAARHNGFGVRGE